MQSVGAAWLMTSLTSNPLYIALIQTASALPFFLLALPAGSIGDIFDRRKALFLVRETGKIPFASVAWPGLVGVVSVVPVHDEIAANASQSRAGWPR